MRLLDQAGGGLGKQLGRNVSSGSLFVSFFYENGLGFFSEGWIFCRTEEGVFRRFGNA